MTRPGRAARAVSWRMPLPRRHPGPSRPRRIRKRCGRRFLPSRSPRRRLEAVSAPSRSRWPGARRTAGARSPWRASRRNTARSPQPPPGLGGYQPATPTAARGAGSPGIPLVTLEASSPRAKTSDCSYRHRALRRVRRPSAMGPSCPQPSAAADYPDPPVRSLGQPCRIASAVKQALMRASRAASRAPGGAGRPRGRGSRGRAWCRWGDLPIGTSA